ncbi:MAG: type IV pilus assembly protein PilA [Bradymonadia bacterium]|jgi:type IV pilus assembly protein PilA
MRHPIVPQVSHAAPANGTNAPGFPPSGPPRQMVDVYPQRKQGGAKIFLLVGCISVVVVMALGVVAAVALPAFLNYQTRSKTAEAYMNIRAIFDGSVAYYSQHGVFPESASQTPTRAPSDITALTTEWSSNPTWVALNFALTDPHDFVYQYDSSQSAGSTSFTASAFGDLDGDGDRSTFIRFGVVEQGVVKGSGGLYFANELE